MTQLDIFSLDGRVALDLGRRRRRSGRPSPRRWRAPGRRSRSRAGRSETLRRDGRAGPRRRLRGPGDHRRRDRRGRRERMVARDHRTLRSRSTSWSTPSAAAPARPPSGRGLPARRVGLDHGAQPAQHDRRRPSRPSRAMIERGHGGAVLNISSVRANLGHQRRLLGLRRGQGRDQLADPPVGDRMGEVRHPGQRDHADLRRHAAGRHAARRSRRSRPASSTGSRSAGSARPATSSARRSSSSPMPRRSSPGQVLGIDGGLTATQ